MEKGEMNVRAFYLSQKYISVPGLEDSVKSCLAMFLLVKKSVVEYSPRYVTTSNILVSAEVILFFSFWLYIARRKRPRRTDSGSSLGSQQGRYGSIDMVWWSSW